jgi:hypothetical protein
MTVVQPLVPQEHAAPSEPMVNKFCLTVATVNGSGSQTSNMTLMRALLKMGIPVSGKNLFPLQYPGPPNLVHYSREPRWLAGPPGEERYRCRYEPGNL